MRLDRPGRDLENSFIDGDCLFRITLLDIELSYFFIVLNRFVLLSQLDVKVADPNPNADIVFVFCYNFEIFTNSLVELPLFDKLLRLSDKLFFIAVV